MKEKLIPRIENIDKTLEIVYFIPIELSGDVKTLLKAAHGMSPTINQLCSILNWEKVRVENTVNKLVSDKLALMDEETVYFPGFE